MRKIKYVEKWGLETAKARYGANVQTPASGPVSPAPDEQKPQFHDDKVGDHVDVGKKWTDGHGSPYPDFDHGKLDRRPPRK
jgi:hypothetical protein